MNELSLLTNVFFLDTHTIFCVREISMATGEAFVLNQGGYKEHHRYYTCSATDQIIFTL